MKFAITLETDEDGFVVVSCPALPGCHSQGTTRDEAIANIKEAIEGFVMSMRKYGEPIPSIDEVQEIEVAV
ncbi:MAG: type II toxin-antitoxin system HicB family antitoxin [SAR202 cluster bacterium]|jgi:predicted RNase H-like HicB family nuclease|nr:type II toxin-antitoxin system HicB family antitoxin [SAR202 cluster bacterium]